MTQTNNSETSNQADAVSSAPFVLDFLYNDSRRIGSFLSQFEVDGHLQSFVRHKDGTKAKTDKSSADLKGSIAAIGAGRGTSTETKFEAKEGYSQTFDPLWSNARTFLDYLNEHDLLERKPKNASIGQFVLAKGHLSILDLSMLKHLWTLDGVKNTLRESIIPKKKTGTMNAAQREEYKNQIDITNMSLEMLNILPHSVQASLILDDEDPIQIWATLQDEYLTTSATDISLTHGNRMPGIWSFVGILNDYPHFDIDQNAGMSAESGLQSVIGGVSKMFAPVVRATLGRPSFAHAVTPLLIYREVA